MTIRRSAAFVTLAVVAIAVGTIAALGSGNPSEPLPAMAQADRIVVEKRAHAMTLFAGDRTLRRYAVAMGRGGLEPKTREGDNRTPEGLYRIDSRNPHSSFHLALHISYPEAKDRNQAALRAENPGSDIMIHGIRNGLGWVGGFHRWLDWTAGCIAVTDMEIEEVWRVVPNGTPVDIRP